VLATTGVAAVIAWKLSDGATGPAPTTTLPAPLPPTPSTATSAAATPSGNPSGKPSGAPSAKPSAKPSAAPPPPVPKDKAACYATLLPEGAFGRTKPNLDSCCTKGDAYRHTLRLKSAIVAAGGAWQITPAMREWSTLGWFETAAFQVMRTHCCPDAPALTVPRYFSRCRLQEALAYIANGIDDDEGMRAALNDYTTAAQCMAKRGWADGFGQYAGPHGGEIVSFEKIMIRVKKARGR
jgi:hypothetical protein